MLVTDSYDNKYRCYTRLVVIYFLYLKASLISATYNDEKALFLQPEKKRQTAQHTGHTTHLDQPIGTSCIVGNAALQYFGKPCSHQLWWACRVSPRQVCSCCIMALSSATLTNRIHTLFGGSIVDVRTIMVTRSMGKSERTCHKHVGN